jgi:hypothetical protein
MYTVKKVNDFPVPSRDVTHTKLSLARKNLYFSCPARVWLVTSRLGTGKSLTFFYSVCTAMYICGQVKITSSTVHESTVSAPAEPAPAALFV